jgi:hypothetical protein
MLSESFLCGGRRCGGGGGHARLGFVLGEGAGSKVRFPFLVQLVVQRSALSPAR